MFLVASFGGNSSPWFTPIGLKVQTGLLVALPGKGHIYRKRDKLTELLPGLAPELVGKTDNRSLHLQRPLTARGHVGTWGKVGRL